MPSTVERAEMLSRLALLCLDHSPRFGDLVVYHFDSIEGINGGTESVAFPNSRYNYTGQDYFVKKKDRGFRHVTSTAKLIIREALPIRCVDAVFLGAYLTADMANVRRTTDLSMYDKYSDSKQVVMSTLFLDYQPGIEAVVATARGWSKYVTSP